MSVLVYADDLVLGVETESDLRRMIEHFDCV